MLQKQLASLQVVDKNCKHSAGYIQQKEISGLDDSLKEEEEEKKLPRSLSFIQKEKTARKRELNKDIDPCDMLDIRNPQSVSEYVKPIFKLMKEQQSHFHPLKNYLDEKVTKKTRAALVEWVTEVHFKFKLFPETLWITINIIDRYLAKRTVPAQQMQILGLAALLIASKYEDIYPPELKEMMKCASSLSAPTSLSTRNEVLNMESLILFHLGFDFSAPTPLRFIERFSKVANADEKTKHVALYVCELAAHDFDLVFKYSPSMLACVGMSIASKTTRGSMWFKVMEKEAGVREEEVKEIINHDFARIVDRIETDLGVKAVHKKYTQYALYEVAKVPLKC